MPWFFSPTIYFVCVCFLKIIFLFLHLKLKHQGFGFIVTMLLFHPFFKTQLRVHWLVLELGPGLEGSVGWGENIMQ